MPFSSGSFSLVSGNPVISGTTISSSVQNNTLSDIATGLSTCLLKDGSQTVTANISLAGFKVTNLGTATARTDAASLANIQDASGTYVSTVGGTADAITLTPSPAIGAYVAGQRFSWIASGANTTATTVNVSGLGAKSLTKNGTRDLVAGDIPSGSLVIATYDGTRFQLVFSNRTEAIVSVASASTVNLSAINGYFADITGTTTITSFGTETAGISYWARFNGVLTLTHNATSLILPGAANISTASGDIARFTSLGSGNWACTSYQKSNGTSIVVQGLPNNYLTGLTMSTAGSSTTMSIASGQAMDSGNAVLMTLGSSINKTTGSWAVGSGNGGLDTGTISNSTWYHIYLIRRPDTGVVDALISLSASSPTMPTNYTQKRRIGSLFVQSGGFWDLFYQTGDDFYWNIPALDLSTTSPSTTRTLITMSVPLGIKVKILMNINVTDSNFDGNGIVYICDPQLSDVAPSRTASPLATAGWTGATNAETFCQGSCWTNTSSQVAYRMNFSRTLRIATLGWTDLRGKL